jgi:hypothetical protein
MDILLPFLFILWISCPLILSRYLLNKRFQAYLNDKFRFWGYCSSMNALLYGREAEYFFFFFKLLDRVPFNSLPLSF